MYYFLKNKDFNLEEYDFGINCSPRLTIKEHEFFNKLIEKYSSDKDFSEIETKNLKYSERELKQLIESINKKSIFCQIFQGNKTISSFYFNIFDIVAIEDNMLIYKFSKEIVLSHKRGNFYNRINMLAFLRFKLQHTKHILKVISRENKGHGYLEYSIEEFKKLLNISEDKYLRYYDFEQKILKPLAKDIELAHMLIDFEKIKNDKQKTSRIIGIRLNYTNSYHVEIHKSTNTILKKFAKDINDFAKAYELIYDYRKIHSEEATINYITENLKTLNL